MVYIEEKIYTTDMIAYISSFSKGLGEIIFFGRYSEEVWRIKCFGRIEI